MYQYVHDMLSLQFNHYFTYKHDAHSHTTRNSTSKALAIKRFSTNRGQNSIKYKGATIWNSIPNLLKLLKIKSSLYSPYCAEACNELRGPSPRLSAWATQLRRNVATVASRWRHCVDLTGPGIEPQTSRTDSMRVTTELTAGLEIINVS